MSRPSKSAKAYAGRFDIRIDRVPMKDETGDIRELFPIEEQLLAAINQVLGRTPRKMSVKVSALRDTTQFKCDKACADCGSPWMRAGIILRPDDAEAQHCIMCAHCGTVSS